MIAMGCLVPAIMHEAAEVIVQPRSEPDRRYWPRTTVLAGDDITPEPDPPTALT